MGSGGGVVLQPVHGDPGEEMGSCAVGLTLEHPFEGLEGLLVPSGLEQRGSEIELQVRVVRRESDRAAEQLDRLVLLPLTSAIRPR